MLLLSNGRSMSLHIDVESGRFSLKDQFKFELKENENEY